MNPPSHISIIIVALIVAASAASAQVQKPPTLKVKWGLENTTYFEETTRNEKGSSSIKTNEENKRRYRAFLINDAYNRKIPGVFDRFGKTKKLFEEESRRTDEKALLNSFIKKNDPTLAGTIQAMAPTMYFDFVGTKDAEYVLEEIEIKTIRFDEYKGGGFSDNEAWYDIELCHEEGTVKKYPIDRMLRFTGSGRCQLRFWSDNYYPGMGMAPMGCYDIDLKFHFRANGKRVSVSTGRFKIDV